jgi:hypothetical protein
MTRKDQVFVVDVVVTNSTLEMVALNVINWPTGAIVEFSTIAKIRKYKRFQERHHFIPMAIEVHIRAWYGLFH